MLPNGPCCLALKTFYTKCLHKPSCSESFAYLEEISQSYTLEQQRNLWESQTEKDICQIAELRDEHQIKTYLRHRSKETRAFILERTLALMMIIMTEPDFASTQEIDGPFPKTLSQTLLLLWADLREYLDQRGVLLNVYLSQTAKKMEACRWDFPAYF